MAKRKPTYRARQTELSVQDVPDYSTREGAAQANEEMRRLALGIKSLKKDIPALIAENVQPAALRPNSPASISNITSTTIEGDTTIIEGGTSSYAFSIRHLVQGFADGLTDVIVKKTQALTFSEFGAYGDPTLSEYSYPVFWNFIITQLGDKYASTNDGSWRNANIQANVKMPLNLYHIESTGNGYSLLGGSEIRQNNAAGPSVKIAKIKSLVAGDNITINEITGSGELVINSADGDILPSGSTNDTMRYGTTDWEANSTLLNYGNSLKIEGNPNLDSNSNLFEIRNTYNNANSTGLYVTTSIANQNLARFVGTGSQAVVFNGTGIQHTSNDSIYIHELFNSNANGSGILATATKKTLWLKNAGTDDSDHYLYCDTYPGNSVEVELKRGGYLYLAPLSGSGEMNVKADNNGKLFIQESFGESYSSLFNRVAADIAVNNSTTMTDLIICDTSEHDGNRDYHVRFTLYGEATNTNSTINIRLGLYDGSTSYAVEHVLAEINDLVTRTPLQNILDLGNTGSVTQIDNGSYQATFNTQFVLTGTAYVQNVDIDSLSLRFAQNTAVAGNLTIFKNSYVIVEVLDPTP